MSKHIFAKTVIASAIALALSQYAQAETTTLQDVVVNSNFVGLIGDTISNDTLKETGKQEGGDILRNTLGVDGSRMGGHGIDPSIRGQSQTQLNVILDDAYLHGGCPNRMDPPTSFANIETYDSVRVIQGVETLQYGTGGTGGTILFERGLPEMGTHGRVEGGVGSNGLKQSATAEVSHRGDQGYIRAFAVNKDGGKYKDGNGNTVNTSFSTEHHGVVAGVTPKAGERIEVSAEKIVTHNALFQGAGMDAPYDEMNILRMKYRSTNKVGFVDGIKADLSYAADQHLMDNFRLRPLTGTAMQVPTTSNTLSGKLALTSILTSTTSIDYGFNLNKVDREAIMKNSAGTSAMQYMWPSATTNKNGVFAEATTKLSKESRLKSGLRFDKVTAEADLINTPTGVAAGNKPSALYSSTYGYTGNGKVNEDHWSGLGRYELDVAKNLTWFAGLSRTMRTADETERFMAKGGTAGTQWVGNPNLNPEKHNQLDTGFSKQTEHYGWKATAFYDSVEDYILRDKNSTGNSIYRNVNATLYGALLEGNTQFSESIQLAGGLSYVNSKNTTDNRNIAQTPPLSGYVALNKQMGDLGLGARFRFQDKQTAIDTVSGLDINQTPAWSVLDLYGSYKINKSVKLMAGVDNVFDHAYYQHIARVDASSGNTYNVYEPGRAAWLKVQAKF